MGTSKSVYAGPYFKCVPKVVRTSRSVRTCPNKRCSHHGEELGERYERYCARCGSAVTEVTVGSSAPTDHYDVVGDALHELGSDDGPEDGNQFLAPNVRRKGAPKRRLNDDDEGRLDLADVDVRAEMDWLRTAFAKELKKLEAAYERVEVRWGVHVYWS